MNKVTYSAERFVARFNSALNAYVIYDRDDKTDQNANGYNYIPGTNSITVNELQIECKMMNTKPEYAKQKYGR